MRVPLIFSPKEYDITKTDSSTSFLDTYPDTKLYDKRENILRACSVIFSMVD
jgi:hypothetical protein